MRTEPRPKRYVVCYVDNAKWNAEAARVGEESVDPANTTMELESDSLDYAQFLKRSIEGGVGSEVRIYERADIYPVVSSSGDHTWWEWDEELVED